MSKKPLKLRVFIRALKEFGVVCCQSKGKSNRGKGSEIILVKSVSEGSCKGPQYPIKNHGEGTEISIPVIRAALRQFGINEKDFWNKC